MIDTFKLIMVKAALAKHMIKAAQDSGTPATPATPSTAPLTDVSGNTIAGHLRNAQSSATAHRARQDAEVAHMARMNQDALASLQNHLRSSSLPAPTPPVTPSALPGSVSPTVPGMTPAAPSPAVSPASLPGAISAPTPSRPVTTPSRPPSAVAPAGNRGVPNMVPPTMSPQEMASANNKAMLSQSRRAPSSNKNLSQMLTVNAGGTTLEPQPFPEGSYGASLSYHPHRQMFESSALKNSKMPDKFQDKDNDFMIPNFYAGVSAPDPRNRTYANRVPMAPARQVFNQMYGRPLSSDEYNWAMSHFLDKFEKGHSGPIGAGAR